MLLPLSLTPRGPRTSDSGQSGALPSPAASFAALVQQLLLQRKLQV